MKLLTLSISVLALMAPVTFITNASIAQSTRPTSPTNISPIQPDKSLKIKNATKQPTKGETATCKGSLYSCQKFISACDAGKGGITTGGYDDKNIPHEFSCTLP